MDGESLNVNCYPRGLQYKVNEGVRRKKCQMMTKEKSRAEIIYLSMDTTTQIYHTNIKSKEGAWLWWLWYGGRDGGSKKKKKKKSCLATPWGVGQIFVHSNFGTGFRMR